MAAAVRTLALLLAAGAWTTRAEAEPALDLTWSAPEGCPSEARVVARVIENVGTTASSLRVHAAAEQRSDGTWRVRIDADRDGERGERELEAESCDAAAEATALIVSLMIDPTWTPKALPTSAEAPASPKGPEATTALASPPAEAAPGVAPPRAETRSPSRTRLPLVSARLSAGGDVGTLASVDGGGELAIALTVARFRFEVAANAWSAATATAAGDRSEGAGLSLLGAGGRVGYVLGAGALAIAPTIGGEVDRMTGAGFGGSAHSSQTAVWGALAAGATGFWSLNRSVALAVTLEGLVPAGRPSFVASEPPPGAGRSIEQPSVVAARAFGGVECRFF